MILDRLYDNSVDWLSHPMRNDYPVWKLFLIFLLFVLVAGWIIDNSSLIVGALKQGVSA